MFGRIRAKGERVSRTGIVLLLVTAAGLVLCGSASATQLSYTFDSGNQGWGQKQDQTSVTTVPAGFLSTGGNPGGHLTAKDTGSDSGCPEGSPCQLLTFYSPVITPLSANYGGIASFDLSSPDVTPAFAAELLFWAAGDNYLDGVLPDLPTNTYNHLSIPLTETANWRVCPYAGGGCTPQPSQGQFKSLLGATDQIGVMADVGPNGTTENYDLDNLTLTESAPTPVTPTSPKKKCKKKHKRAAVAKKKCKQKHRRSASAGLRG